MLYTLAQISYPPTKQLLLTATVRSSWVYKNRDLHRKGSKPSRGSRRAGSASAYG